MKNQGIFHYGLTGPFQLIYSNICLTEFSASGGMPY